MRKQDVSILGGRPSKASGLNSTTRGGSEGGGQRHQAHSSPWGEDPLSDDTLPTTRMNHPSRWLGTEVHRVGCGQVHTQQLSAGLRLTSVRNSRGPFLGYTQRLPTNSAAAIAIPVP